MATRYDSSKTGVGHSSRAKTASVMMALLLQHAPAAANEDVCALFHTETDMVSQTLYMHQEDVSHELVFPRIYFEDAWDRRDDQIHEAQLFRVMIDDFSPVTRSETAGLLKSRPARFMTFVIHDLVGLDRLTEIVLSDAAPQAKRGLSDFQVTSANYGLQSFAPFGGQTMYRDVFVKFDTAGTVQTVISCGQAGDVLNPSCTQDFRTADVDVRINYARAHLPEWSVIEGKIERFLGCARGASDTRDE
ncbi:hypothetical protein [uncultured Roseobacter sp.]|uniref:hypothetical protein n=1 Tax=uncultured Roseobacter sp. TaxID=114847 RepID=UPI00260FB01B|nr:hypothetical protein [uncultured Roseobacter sp.]